MITSVVDAEDAGRHRVGAFAGRPLAEHQDMSGVVEVDEQFVAQVALEAGQIPPDGFSDLTALDGRGRREAGLPRSALPMFAGATFRVDDGRSAIAALSGGDRFQGSVRGGSRSG